MTLTTLVVIDGEPQSAGTLTATVGSEVRGVQDTPSFPPFGPYTGQPMYQITLYADDPGETLSFSFYNGRSALISLDETLVFEVNGNLGSVVAPLELTGSTPSPSASP